MKLGTRVSVGFTGHVVRDAEGFIDVEDETTGVVHRVSKYNGEAQAYRVELPLNWPPQVHDVWKHLSVTFLVESRGDTIWMLASNGEGSLSPDEVLRMRPGIELVSRQASSVYTEEFDKE
jgi:hypothetical protein